MLLNKVKYHSNSSYQQECLHERDLTEQYISDNRYAVLNHHDDDDFQEGLQVQKQ